MYHKCAIFSRAKTKLGKVPFLHTIVFFLWQNRENERGPFFVAGRMINPWTGEEMDLPDDHDDGHPRLGKSNISHFVLGKSTNLFVLY